MTAAAVPTGQRAAIAVDQIIVRAQHRAVAGFDRRHLVEQRQVAVERNLPAIEEQQVIQGEEHIGVAQAGG